MFGLPGANKKGGVIASAAIPAFLLNSYFWNRIAYRAGRPLKAVGLSIDTPIPKPKNVKYPTVTQRAHVPSNAISPGLTVTQSRVVSCNT